MYSSTILGLVSFLRQSPLPPSHSPSPSQFGDSSILNCSTGRRSPGEDCPLPPFLSNISPWHASTSEKCGGVEPGPGWEVQQVHMLSRHGETFPDAELGAGMVDLVRRIRHGNITLKGDLAFVNTWNMITADPESDLGNLITTGCYAGTLQAFTTGVKLRTRYRHLLDAAAGFGRTSFWAAGFGRGIDTAEHFASGLWGLDWDQRAVLHIIPQDVEREADTLTPSKTCLDYTRDTDSRGHGYGDRMLRQFLSTYTPSVVERLTKQTAGLIVTDYDVYIMQEICGFETLVKGNSQWCAVFSREEMEAFEYARDLLLYYRSGPGNPFAATMGWLWLNATAELLAQGPTAGPLFFSFAHDNDLLNVVSTLGLYEQSHDLPTSGVQSDRNWHASQITPMGGRIIIERIVKVDGESDADTGSWNMNSSQKRLVETDVYIRITVNDGILALPNCDSGPGRSCPLGDFIKWVRDIGYEKGDFGHMCGLGKDAQKRIEFLHQ